MWLTVFRMGNFALQFPNRISQMRAKGDEALDESGRIEKTSQRKKESFRNSQKL
jgi:hypothetical protein